MLDLDISTADAHALLTARDDDPDGVSRRRFLQLVGAGVGTGALTGLDGLLPAPIGRGRPDRSVLTMASSSSSA